MFNNPDPFYSQVKRAADKGFSLQGSRFRFYVVAESIGELKAKHGYSIDFGPDSLPERGMGVRLLTVSELREEMLTAAIELSNAIRGDLYWNFGVEVHQPCKACGQYYCETHDQAAA